MLAASAILMLGAGAAVAPRGVSAAAMASACTDSAWAYYNECLVEARMEFCRKICDVEFLILMSKCNYQEMQ